MSKRDKEIQKLLHKKTLSSKEAVRLLELNGWIQDKNARKTGTSHQQFIHPDKKEKTTVPAGRKTLPEATRKSILEQAGLMGD
ncbi:MAG: type II toxin-antitoxin system HicA family toxin [Synergistaceae bacterium]|nr:type II toxin-antitoxin system HicA family toxin [Synergistaceae bacterium]